MWRVKVGVQVSRREFHTYIHLDYARIEILSCIKKKKKKKKKKIKERNPLSILVSIIILEYLMPIFSVTNPFYFCVDSSPNDDILLINYYY